MKHSDLSHSCDEYEVVIIGGGIVGAGVFRDLCAHGVKTLLVDKKDFSSQTSSASSKMLHGGIRYLENFDLKLVYEALHEKNHWLKVAPHLCQERPFYFPIYKESKRPLWQLKVGMAAYDLLSGFQNTPHKVYNSVETQNHLKGIKAQGLRGSGMYHDAIVDDFKMTLEVLLDGLHSHKESYAANYVSFQDVRSNNDQLIVSLNDELDNSSKEIKAKYIIFATGPFTDKVLTNVEMYNWKSKILPSKGSHLWLKRDALEIEHPMVLNTKDNRIIFVIPHDDKILVGTTEEDIKGEFFDLTPSKEEVDYLISTINHYFPESKVDHSSILRVFAGVRPLVKEGDSDDKGKTAREHKVIDLGKNSYCIIGGKYTTFRVMAKDVVMPILSKMNIRYNESLCKSPLQVRSIVLPFEHVEVTPQIIEQIKENELVRQDSDLKRRLGESGQDY